MFRTGASRRHVTLKLATMLRMYLAPGTIDVLLMFERSLKGCINVAEIVGTYRRTMYTISIAEYRIRLVVDLHGSR